MEDEARAEGGGHLLEDSRCSGTFGPGAVDTRPQLWPWLKRSSTVALVLSNSHCWLRDAGSHVFMKTRLSLGLLSMQLLLTGWYKRLSCRKGRGKFRFPS